MLSSPQLEQQSPAFITHPIGVPLSLDLSPAPRFRRLRRSQTAGCARPQRVGESAAELSRRRALVRGMTPAARACRALNSWCGRVDERRQLLHATAALRHREVFVALNTWRSYARERRSRAAKIGGVLDTLSPQGRAVRRAFNSWAPLVGERAALRRGAMAIKHRELDVAQRLDRGRGRAAGARAHGPRGGGGGAAQPAWR